VDDHAESVHQLTVEHDVELHEVALLISVELVFQRTVASGL
jgi:hypothetical protein